ncbi:hypothetical protein ID866_7288, partial [Astraeus odoratus]
MSQHIKSCSQQFCSIIGALTISCFSGLKILVNSLKCYLSHLFNSATMLSDEHENSFFVLEQLEPADQDWDAMTTLPENPYVPPSPQEDYEKFSDMQWETFGYGKIFAGEQIPSNSYLDIFDCNFLSCKDLHYAASETPSPVTSSLDLGIEPEPSLPASAQDEWQMLFQALSTVIPALATSSPSSPEVSQPETKNLSCSLGPMRPQKHKRAPSNMPVPLPHVMNKARGRKVAVSLDGQPIYGRSADKAKNGVRSFLCTAEGCNAIFVRNEHLKRHIRSIHTQEQPWCCPMPGCGLTFSRKDNWVKHCR